MRKLEEILNIGPSETVSEGAIQKVEEVYAAVFDPKDERFNADFEEVRENISQIIKDTRSSMKTLGVIAKESEKSADFMALSSLTKVLVDANKQLLVLYEIKKEYNREELKNSGGTTIHSQNSVFVGTTKDLKGFVK